MHAKYSATIGPRAKTLMKTRNSRSPVIYKKKCKCPKSSSKREWRLNVIQSRGLFLWIPWWYNWKIKYYAPTDGDITQKDIRITVGRVLAHHESPHGPRNWNGKMEKKKGYNILISNRHEPEVCSRWGRGLDLFVFPLKLGVCYIGHKYPTINPILYCKI